MAKPGPNSLANLKPWPKGVSGNPGGRKRKVITEGLLDLLDKKKVGGLELPEGRTLIEVILEGIVRNVMAGNAKTISDLWERFEGKVAQELVATPDNPLVQAIQGFFEKTQAPKRAKPKSARPKAKAAAKGGGRVARRADGSKGRD